MFVKQPFHDKTHIVRYYLNIKRTDRIPILFIGAVLKIWFPTAILWITFDLAVGTNITMI